MLNRFRHLLSLALLVMSLVALVWGVWPGQRSKLVQAIEPASMRVPGPVSGLAVLEPCQVTLEWPGSLRLGDQGSVTLVFAPVDGDTASRSSVAGFTDVYASYNLMAEGRLEASGLRVNPSDPRRESLPSGQSVKYGWLVNAQKAAIYPAQAWLLLRFLPLHGGNASEVPVFVHEVEIRETSLLGLSGPAARVVGGFGFLISLALSYDLLVNFLKKSQRSLWTRR